MYEKTGKIRRKKEGQVLGKRPLPMALLRFEKTPEKKAQCTGSNREYDNWTLRRLLCTKARERLQWMVGFCKIQVRASLPYFKTLR